MSDEIKVNELNNEKEAEAVDEKEASAAKAASKKRIFRLERRARKKRHDISLRAFITIMIIAVCTLILVIYMGVSSSHYKSRYTSQLLDRLEFNGKVIASDLIDNDFKISNSDNLGDNIDMIATQIDGRILIVNSSYMVIKDTFVTNEYSYIINSDIMTAMGNGKISYKQTSDYLQYIYPVCGTDGVLGVIVMVASNEKAEQLSNQMHGHNVFIFVFITILTIAVAVIVGRASVRGLTFINKQMEFTGDGNFNNRIPERGFKEFRMMTEKYNATLNKIMVLDSTRQEFVSNVSHELKTPIASMKVLAESLIENEQADLAMYKEFMTDISDEIERETKIINDLLTLVKMDKKSAKLNIAELNINELLEIIIKRVTPIAQSRGIEISYDSYRDVTAEVDEVKLSLAFTNIIENAVKYNVDNGSVNVTLNTDHKYFYVKVADSGVGIPDDCKDQVFDRFYRVDKARSRDTGGTGLGLAITKEAVLMHKGTIKLYSESGQGTTFTIKIPIKFADV